MVEFEPALTTGEFETVTIFVVGWLVHPPKETTRV